MMEIVLIGVGGAVGAICRYSLGLLVAKKNTSQFPWGTFIINMLGSFVLGYLLGNMGSLWLKQNTLGLMIGTGVLGGFTTFSTYCYEGLHLFHSKESFIALSYLIISILLGVALAAIGLYIGLI